MLRHQASSFVKTVCWEPHSSDGSLTLPSSTSRRVISRNASLPYLSWHELLRLVTVLLARQARHQAQPLCQLRCGTRLSTDLRYTRTDASGLMLGLQCHRIDQQRASSLLSQLLFEVPLQHLLLTLFTPLHTGGTTARVLQHKICPASFTQVSLVSVLQEMKGVASILSATRQKGMWYRSVTFLADTWLQLSRDRNGKGEKSTCSLRHGHIPQPPRLPSTQAYCIVPRDYMEILDVNRRKGFP
ncbi:hypothetical protein Anapl_13143 [Anas platyrhynchos]|uniref:Uncharacterized protein n=1 Tax=Anas platyrhynchos TaxID=8839 RepID=R0LBP2_ANAPL|nr:hypothetical protein Anapl_13143 [Anas platyrhynchos]